ncbi:transmembrane and coiled-coil domains protein 2 [Lepeophtheirus salmonis]|uniref:transmembrane and coiled-coil domains protein 2 n=1 Tax=Lepeophtheirus salmonis TaxID=72036 RepID=UPI003AF35ABB
MKASRGCSPSNNKSTTGASSEQDEDSSGASEEEALAEIHNKISSTKEKIKKEQKNRDDNVDEYLKLSTNATDKAQQYRIKQVFEKKNAKSAANIAQYQKKLDSYLKRLQAHKESSNSIPSGGSSSDKPPVVFKGLKNVRHGTKSILGKPKELFAQHLLRKFTIINQLNGHTLIYRDLKSPRSSYDYRHKFGSADNLSSLSKDESSCISPQIEETSSKMRGSTPRGSGSLPRDQAPSSLLSAPNNNSFDQARKCISEDGRRSEFSESIDSNHPSSGAGGVSGAAHPCVAGGEPSSDEPKKHNSSSSKSAEWKAIIQELTLHKEEVERLREDMEEMRAHFKQVVDSINYQLREERDRYERLEEQMNDLTELHQHEIENIKSGVNDMEEKVQYQSDERLREITEHLQSLETKITSLEHQQTQQQYLNIEGLDSTNARAIMMKLITAALTILHVILFVIGIFMNIAKPFFQTTARAILTVLCILSFVLLHHQWHDVEAYYIKLKNWQNF